MISWLTNVWCWHMFALCIAPGAVQQRSRQAPDIARVCTLTDKMYYTNWPMQELINRLPKNKEWLSSQLVRDWLWGWGGFQPDIEYTRKTIDPISAREVFIQDLPLAADLFVAPDLMAPCALTYKQNKGGEFLIWSWIVVLHVQVYTVGYGWHIGSSILQLYKMVPSSDYRMWTVATIMNGTSIHKSLKRYITLPHLPFAKMSVQKFQWVPLRWRVMVQVLILCIWATELPVVSKMLLHF